jgi:hypothetical protein
MANQRQGIGAIDESNESKINYGHKAENGFPDLRIFTPDISPTQQLPDGRRGPAADSP